MNKHIALKNLPSIKIDVLIVANINHITIIVCGTIPFTDFPFTFRERQMFKQA